jgi:hypothetical protein
MKMAGVRPAIAPSLKHRRLLIALESGRASDQHTNSIQV